MRHDRRSPNFDARGTTVVDMLVLHYTGMRSAAAALDRLTDPAAEVSAHYVIDEDGAIHALVDEKDRAWHAGRAHWRGHTNINARSIGIEIVNPGHEFGYREFPPAQMAAVTALSREVLARHPVPARNVVGHSDVAPSRKQDPGELFDWAGLAAAGVGLWPTGRMSSPLSESAVPAALRDIGYDVSDLAAAVTAFQRHFRPADVGGKADEETRSVIAAVRALYTGAGV